MTKLHPDRLTEIDLIGTSSRLLGEGRPRDEIVDELRKIANGRTDLLGQAAGHHLGGYLGSRGTHWDGIDAAAVLIQAGADPLVVVKAADQTRRNSEQEPHTAGPALIEAAARARADAEATDEPGPVTPDTK